MSSNKKQSGKSGEKAIHRAGINNKSNPLVNVQVQSEDYPGIVEETYEEDQQTNDDIAITIRG